LTYNSDEEAQSIWSTMGDRAERMDEGDRPFALQTHVDVNFLDNTWGGGAKGIKQAKKWLEGSYELWKQWTGYLVEDALEPHNQRKNPTCEFR
jgi:hypothetical protein